MEMKRKKFEIMVKKTIAEKMYVEPESIKDDDSLGRDLGLDSLDVAEILMKVEKETGRGITDTRLEDGCTVKEFTDYMYEDIYGK